MSRSFIRSTIDVRQFSCCLLLAARPCRTASTSTAAGAAGAGAAGAAGFDCADGAPAVGAGGRFGCAAALLPKIASLILLTMLITPPAQAARGRNGESLY